MDGDIIEFVKKNINKKVNGEPMYWVLPNKLYFPSWVTSTFSEFKLSPKPEPFTKGVFSPLKYQRFLKKYMQPVSPYRGLLLFHGLGSGKTCTAIGIAEQFKDKKNVVVLLPASLRHNFIKKGILFCADEKYKQVTNSYKKVYTFISYNAANTPDQIKRIGNLDNKVIIIEEAHNLISRMVGGILGNNKNGKFIYDTLLNAKNSRIIALTGTPVQKDPYELALLMNVLRGKIEITQFKIDKIGYSYGSKPDLSKLEKELTEIDAVDYLEMNITAKFIEFHIIPKSYNKEYKLILAQIKELCLKHDITVHHVGTEGLMLFPEDPDDFDEEYITSDQLGERLKDKQIFQKRIMGLISYYQVSQEDYPDKIDKGILRVPMSDYQREYYQFLREKERKSESGSSVASSSKRRKSGGKSTFRVYTRQASNFVFPKDIPRPYKDKKFVVFKSGKKNNNNENENIENDIKNMNKENNIDEGTEQMDKEYRMRQAKSLAELSSRADEYLVAGPEGLNKLSPKMLMMLENIKTSKRFSICLFKL